MNGNKKPLKDLTGQTFGKYTALEYAGSSKWKCQCTCGIINEVRTSDLNNGNSQGCKKCQNRLKEKSQSGLNILYGKYKRRAKEYNREFSLTLDEFKNLTSSTCHYCGIEPQHTITSPKHVSEESREFAKYTYNGIDRKNSALGYTLENSLCCCETCNKAKLDMSYEDFLNYIQRLIKYYEK